MNPKFESICARIRKQQQKNNNNILDIRAESPSASTASFNRSPPLSSISSHSSPIASHLSTPEPLSSSSGIGTSLNNTTNSFNDSLKYSPKRQLKFSIENILKDDFANNIVSFS